MESRKFSLFIPRFFENVNDGYTLDACSVMGNVNRIERITKQNKNGHNYREISQILYEENLIDDLRSLYTYSTLQKSHYVKDLIREGCFTADEMEIWQVSSEYLNTPLPDNKEERAYIQNLKAQRAKLNRVVRNIVAKLLNEVFPEEVDIIKNEKWKSEAKRKLLDEMSSV
jgi:hypothetical protein